MVAALQNDQVYLIYGQLIGWSRLKSHPAKMYPSHLILVSPGNNDDDDGYASYTNVRETRQ